MIIVVEGASAAGKSTWCAKHARGLTVPELRFPDPKAALGLGEEAAARFWSLVNAARWRLALEMEAQNGDAVCDTDPLKLHYTWCLWRVGEVDRSHFDRAVAAARDRFLVGDLGFADMVLFKDASESDLREQRERDTLRRRGSFELHIRMRGALRQWYETLELVRPGSVRFELPADGLHSIPRDRRPDRSDLKEFGALLSALG